MYLLVSTKESSKLTKRRKGVFNNVFNSDGELGTLCDMEDLEDKYLMSTLYPMVFPSDAGNFSLIMKVMNPLRKEGTSQIIIHLIQCMLAFQNIKSKRGMLIISKTMLGKGKRLYGTICFDERLLTYLKEGASLYVDGAGMTNNKQNKRIDYVH